MNRFTQSFFFRYFRKRIDVFSAGFASSIFWTQEKNSDLVKQKITNKIFEDNLKITKIIESNFND